ncbi:bifunctional biotin--[acetyl-CoA-carboxylase] ligase/biotin operon repressor BirA [Ramlibacter solisilvae]|uniref:Biotin--acetyl-CoA-carboxylase ligase n=1 Tax=Ramlibacter tataouinensis TaxID=94132 RepID=A0A127JT75_9BURK|nr:biotin--[acetyl-CoA-carboxylase] ligase [Ramlibacter tataouinensis]AMO23145.1 biotin--acetyl-CoA-carboxylase ligase [Ramlibacter tataouinensis]
MTWNGGAIEAAVTPLLPGFAAELVAEIDSTNAELMRRARAGFMAPTLLAAERQTAGRGRLGRGWHSAAGDSLTFSLGLPLAPADWSGLSLAVGVALAEALHPRLALKWPNDLWFEDRKLGGILIETASLAAAQAPRYAVIGVGLNLRPPPGEGLSTPPAALDELLPSAAPGDILLRVARPLVEAVKAFEIHGFAPFRSRFNARDALRGRAVVLSDGREGTAAGAGESGALLVHTAAGMASVSSAEVSVRPAVNGP